MKYSVVNINEELTNRKLDCMEENEICKESRKNKCEKNKKEEQHISNKINFKRNCKTKNKVRNRNDSGDGLKVKNVITADSVKNVNKLYFFIFLVIAIGIVIGISGYFTFESDIIDAWDVSSFYDDISLNQENEYIMSWRANVIYQNVKYVLIIFLISSFTSLYILIPAILFYKGFSYSFSILYLIKSLGKLGVKISCFLYIPFAIICILILILHCKISIKYIYNKKNYNKNYNKNDIHNKSNGSNMLYNRRQNLIYYMKSLGILCVMIIVGILEVILTPMIISIIK